jgi:hypothetical protein
MSVALLEEPHSRFPPNLVSLIIMPRWNPSTGFSWPKIFHLLPPCIERLKIISDSEMMNLDDWTALSTLTSLKVLSFGMDRNDVFDAEQAQLIPRSVEELNISYRDGDGMSPEWLVRVLQALPKTLRIMEGFWIDDDHLTREIAQNLPRTLEKAESVAFPLEFVNFLPDSLTTLRIGEIGFAPKLKFPLNLRKLSIVELPLEMIEKLPKHLESLEMFEGPAIEGKFYLEQLPRSLTKFSSWQSGKPIDGVVKMLRYLPPKLTTLEVRPMPNFRGRVHPVSTPTKSSLLVSRSMKTLALGCLDFSNSNMAEWVLGLPDTLTSLDLFIRHLQVGGLSSFGRLSALKELNITVLTPPKKDEGWKEYLQLAFLPSGLLRLSLCSHGHLGTTNITDDTFLGAPTSLTSVTIQFSPYLTEGCLDHLPKLRELAFATYYHRTTPSWFHSRF